MSLRYLAQLWNQPPVPHKIHVVASMNRILVKILPELKCKEGVLAPGHIFLNLKIKYIVL